MKHDPNAKNHRHWPTYLGDGLYAYVEPDHTVVVYSSDGLSEKNHVYLEPEVGMKMLVEWWAQIR